MPVKPWNVFDSRECRLGEGPFYDDRAERVYWVNVLDSLILWRSFDRTDSGSLPVPGHVGAAVPRVSGGLVACLPEGVAALPEGTSGVAAMPDGTTGQPEGVAGNAAGMPDGTTGQPEGAPGSAAGVPEGAAALPEGASGVADATTGDWLARYPEPVEGLRSNDAKADPRGRLWHGTMAYDEGPARGALYRLDPGASETKPMVPGVTVSNGMGWSPDGTRMYYIDSPTKRVDVFDFDMDSGAVEGRRPFATIEEGFPDGMCVDAEGGLWVAIWLGHKVIRFLPDGSVDRVLELPVPKVTSCAFAGPEFDTLIVTTVGPTYAFEIDDVRGTPVDRFAG